MKEGRSSGPARLACIDKPAGLTSFDVVARVRRATGCRRVGHGGTLDPFATGVLVIGIGPATRLMRFLSAGRKVYEATVRFGAETDSEDLTGEILSENDRIPSVDEIQVALPDFLGLISQVPPRLSAVHIDGERSYRRARRGEDVEPPAREVEIHALEVLGQDGADVRIRVECGGGTYIRSLARDLARALDAAAHLSALRRVQVGPFEIGQALSPDAFAEHWEGGGRGLPPSALVAGWPFLELDADRVAEVRHGRQPDPDWWSGRDWDTLPDNVALLDDQGALVGVAEADPAGLLRLGMILPETP
jgi:tRNA pseudouridine55 synthase